MIIAKVALAILLVNILLFPAVLGQTILDKKSYKQQELYCLAKNIYFEARGEPLLGKIAVAQVTINRHMIYKQATVCEVVYQKNQFSWTSTKKKILDKKQWEYSIYIAKAVLEGKLYLKEFKALYFHNINIKPKWSYKKYYLKTIGKHKFYT